jgi:hypothetical protein
MYYDCILALGFMNICMVSNGRLLRFEGCEASKDHDE